MNSYDINLEKVPTHIAIIMDGNGRWAKSRFLPRTAGHKAGVEAIREVIVLYKGVNGYGQIFRIVEQNPGDENLINPVDGALSYFIAKDKPYVVGTPTGLGYDENATDFEEYMKLYNEAKDVINSIEVLQ